MTYKYRTQGVCASEISFDYEDGRITDIKFFGGCNGNLKAISKILDGWDYKDIVAKCEGNTCGFKKTSCADQLAKAVSRAAAEQGAEQQ